MRYFAIALLLTLIGCLAVLGSQQPTWACSPLDSISLTVEVLQQAEDLADLNADDGPFRRSYEQQIEQSNLELRPPSASETLPRIASVSRRTTVARAEPPSGEYSGVAGVLNYEAAWREVPGVSRPETVPFDTSSCAGEFDPPPLGESEWIVRFDYTEATSSIGNVRFHPSPDDLARAEEQLTRLFGEPARPTLSPAQVERAMQQIVSQGEEYFDKPVSDIRYLAGFEPVGQREPASATGFPTGLALVVGAVLIGSGFAVWQARRP